MALPKINPTTTEAWVKLQKHFDSLQSENMNDWFAKDTDRAQKFQIHWEDFLVDYSKNRITSKTIDLLTQLAEETGLKEAIEEQFNGKIINETENRAVLHTILRHKDKPKPVRDTLGQIKTFSDAVISGEWKGYTGKQITDVVNIGIGGSDLGPKMVVESLQFYRNHLKLHFLSNVDGDQNSEICSQLDPETTLFIVVSKSFTTLETITNAHTIREWFLTTAPQKAIIKHFVAVSSNHKQAEEFGIAKTNIFPMWDWVGGRFSLWSAVGLSTCCAIGYNHFMELLDGAQEMDQHFVSSEFKDNIPIILGLLSVWYNNFFKTETEAIIPYSHYLNQLVPYLQQAFMESNGKDISRKGEKIDYQTGSIIWGATGSNAQHAFFQLLHQGTKLVPCDFIGFKKSLHRQKESHHKLMANFFAQTEALLKGKSKTKVSSELKNYPEEVRTKLIPYKTFAGNKPTTTILIEQLTPRNLGSLLAMYEHKIFVQGIIWNIFSFDQWGVELGKQLSKNILAHLKSPENIDDLNGSTKELLKNFLA